MQTTLGVQLAVTVEIEERLVEAPTALLIGHGKTQVSQPHPLEPTVVKTLLDVEAQHHAPLRSAAPRSGARPQ
jgi:hypothetical protein